MLRLSTGATFALSLFILFPSSWTIRSGSATSALPILEVAVEDAASPWSSRDGTGFANELVAAAYRAAGIQVDYKVVPYARCKFLVKKGELPACVSVSPEPGVQVHITLSQQPLYHLTYDYYQNRRHPLPVKNARELPPGTVVGIVNGYEYPDSVARERERGVVFETARDEATNLEKLARGRLDAVIISHNRIKKVSEVLQNAGVQQKVDFAFRAGSLNAYVGFSKRNPASHLAQEKFKRGYERIKNDGTLRDLENKWVRRLRETG
jgi:polar amino acid transport system substrate-binding protein